MKNLAACIVLPLLLVVPSRLLAQTAYNNHLIVSAFERQLNPTNAIAPNTITTIRNTKGSRLIAEVSHGDQGNGFTSDSTVYTYSGPHGGDYEDNTTAFPIRYDIATTYTSEEQGAYHLASRKLQEYNAQDQIVSVTTQEWNGLSWVPSDRTLYSYNTAGLNETTISQVYQIASDSWLNVYKIAFTYNDAEQVVLARYDAWDGESNMYIPTEQNLYNYSPEALTYIIQLYNKENGLFENSSRYIYYFNNNQTQKAESHHNWKGGEWIGSDSTYMVHNGRSNTTENIFYSFHKGDWGRYGHYIINYNDAGRQLTSVDERINPISEDYDGVAKDALTYNNYNQRTSLISYDLKSSKPVSRAKYYYETYNKSVGNVIAEGVTEMNIYPIPAQKSITVAMTLPEAQKISCGIYDLGGKKLQSFQREAGTSYTEEVSTTELPAGTYWFRVTTNGNNQLSKSFTVIH